MVSPKYCKCGSRMAQWRTECRACSEKQMAQWAKEQELRLEKITKAIQHGAVFTTPTPAGIATVKGFYHGVPGIWFTSDKGHYCLSSTTEFALYEQAVAYWN